MLVMLVFISRVLLVNCGWGRVCSEISYSVNIDEVIVRVSESRVMGRL